MRTLVSNVECEAHIFFIAGWFKLNALLYIDIASHDIVQVSSWHSPLTMWTEFLASRGKFYNNLFIFCIQHKNLYLYNDIHGILCIEILKYYISVDLQSEHTAKIDISLSYAFSTRIRYSWRWINNECNKWEWWIFHYDQCIKCILNAIRIV